MAVVVEIPSKDDVIIDATRNLVHLAHKGAGKGLSPKAPERLRHLLSHRFWKRVVPWEAVARGWVYRTRASNGPVRDEGICLEDARGRRVWEFSTRSLPRDVRADLFAWLQARARLREPEAGDWDTWRRRDEPQR